MRDFPKLNGAREAWEEEEWREKKTNRKIVYLSELAEPVARRVGGAFTDPFPNGLC